MVNSGNIKNIIFDFGGVILNIDFERSVQAFRLLGIEEFGMLYSQHMQNELFNKLEKGMISPDDFRNELQDISGLYMTNEEIDEAWNALILDLPAYRIKMLDLVRSNYRIFLLSNSNVIHYECYIQQLRKEHGYRSFDEIFKKAYFSQDMGMRKPDEEIYQKVLKEQQLNPQETLFIDDSYPNIETAVKLGMMGHHLDIHKGEDVCWLFDSKGCLRFYD
jgi:putative hydrolase of the HAD superfamily